MASTDTAFSPASSSSLTSSRSDLNPKWIRHGRERPLDAGHQRVGAEEVVEDEDDAAWFTDPVHLPKNANRIGHDAHGVRRIDEVERVVRETQLRRVHLHEAAGALGACHTIACPRQHRCGQVDARDA